MALAFNNDTGASHVLPIAVISMLLVAAFGMWWAWSQRTNTHLVPDTLARGDALAQKNDPDVGTAGEWVRLAIFSDRMNEALATIRKIKESRADPLLKIDFLSAVALAFARAGKTKEARQLTAEALPLIQKFQNQPLRKSHLSSLATTLAVAGDTKEALELLKQNGLWNTSTLTWICWELSQIGKSDTVVQLAAGALVQATEVHDTVERAQALGDAAWALHLAGNTRAASAAAEQALALVRNLPVENHKYALQAVAISLAVVGKLHEAVTLAKNVGYISQFSTTENIAKTLIRVHKLRDALLVARETNDTYGDAASLIDVSKALAHEGNFPDALQAADEALASANRITGDTFRYQALARAAETFAEIGNSEKATDTARQALAAAKQVGTGQWEYLREPAIALARAGNVDESLTVAAEIADKDQRASTAAYSAVALAETGQTRDVYKAVAKALEYSKAVESELFAETVCSQTTKALSRIHAYRDARRIADACPDYVLFSDEPPKSGPDFVGPWHVVIDPRLEGYTNIVREDLIQRRPEFKKYFDPTTP